MYTGEPLSADEALRIGLVNQVVPSREGMTAAYQMAQKIAGYSLQALFLVLRKLLTKEWNKILVQHSNGKHIYLGRCFKLKM